MNELSLTLKEAELIRAYYMGDTYSGNREDVKAAFQKVEDFVIRKWNNESRCNERESGGVRCELKEGHSGNHACPKALEAYRNSLSFISIIKCK